MLICPSCGKENPDGFQFCGFCTAPLTAQPAAFVREERKVVTVLFCDLVGFTAASEAADPEDVRARIRPYHARLRKEIELYGGTVEKFIGDAVMAVFGAPVAHEDDAERAVRAGLRVLEAIEELNAEDVTLALQVRIGINTGEAVVALGARPEEGEGIVTGDVVNTASRLQAVAPVNGIAVSEATYRATERVFEFEELEPVQVKGKAQRLAIFRPLAPRARFGSDVTRTHTTPLVGRELEKSLLIGTFERSAQQRSCQLVTIVGEPGVGKSRLCGELFAYIEDRPGLVRWRQGRCLPYGEGIAFWALGEIVKAECGILETDSPDEAEAKIEEALPAADPDFAWLKARLAPLVGVGGEPASQEESFAAWRRVLESWAEGRETVLVFEDLHWADEALLSFLEHLADWAEGVPLLLLCTARPELYERHPGFGANARNAQRINLAPLTEEETARLIAALLERAVLPAETQQELLERAGGNPLYAEEFVRLLSDRGELGEAVEVPDSVQALIAARLDTLSPERKSLLQDAAVLGKVFWGGALAQMGGREPREVEIALHELARNELVRAARSSSMEGEHEYGFWHVLVRDVCYGQIPRAARAARHRAAAAWVEEKAGERVADLADVLAHHCVQALELARASGQTQETRELEARAIRYLALAGERALSLDVDRAEQHLAQALDLALPDDPERASLLERWAQAAQQQGRLQEARQALEQALDLYRRPGRSAGGRPRPDPPLSCALPARRPTKRRDDRRGSRAARDATRRAGARRRPHLHGREPRAHRPLPGGGRGRRAGIRARRRARAARAGIRAPLPRPRPLPAGGSRRPRGHAPGARPRARAGPGPRNRRHPQQPRRRRGVLRGATGRTRRLEGRHRLLRAARHHRVRAPHARGQPGHAGRARTDTAGARRDRAARRPDASHRRHGVRTWLRGLQLRLLAECGTPDHAPDPDELVTAARDIGLPSAIAPAFAAAAQLLLAQRQPEQAHTLLRELDQLTATGARPPRAPRSSRLCCASCSLSTTSRSPNGSPTGIDPVTPLDRAPARRPAAPSSPKPPTSDVDAARLYEDAAERWREFGSVPERAYALLGQGRCLAALGKPEAQEPLRVARELFASMGYKPALAETEALLRQSEAAAV